MANFSRCCLVILVLAAMYTCGLSAVIAADSSNQLLRTKQVLLAASPSYKLQRLKPLEGKVDYSGDQGAAENSEPPDSSSEHTAGGIPAENNARNFEGMTSKFGNRFQFRIPRTDSSPAFPLGTSQAHSRGALSKNELNLLKSCDLVVLQDRSTSMGEDELVLGRNGQGLQKLSRWQWCLEEAMDFTRQTSVLPNWSFTLVLFSTKYDVYHNVGLRQIPSIYSRSGIFLGTRVARPLGEQISQYFQRKSTGMAKPLIVVVITDGKPQDDDDLSDLLIQTTHYMSNPREIKVTFLQVGTSEKGSRRLQRLDERLQRQGAKYDIVAVKPFQDLLQVGLARALVETIQER